MNEEEHIGMTEKGRKLLVKHIDLLSDQEILDALDSVLPPLT